MKTHPENAALFAACNTPQEVIEALNAVTGWTDGRADGRADAALFSPNNNPSWTKEMEALFRAAKSESPAKGSDVSGGGSTKDADEEDEDDFEEDDDDDEDDTDDDMDVDGVDRGEGEGPELSARGLEGGCGWRWKRRASVWRCRGTCRAE